MELKRKKITIKEVEECFKNLGKDTFLSNLYFDKDKLDMDIYIGIKKESYNSFIRSCLIDKISDKMFFIRFFSRAIPKYNQYELYNYQITPIIKILSLEDLCSCIFNYFTGKNKITITRIAKIFKNKKQFEECFEDTCFAKHIFKDYDFYKCIKKGKKVLSLYAKKSIEEIGQLPHNVINLKLNERDINLSKNEILETYFVSIEAEI